jgi:hypothetical protein
MRSRSSFEQRRISMAILSRDLLADHLDYLGIARGLEAESDILRNSSQRCPTPTFGERVLPSLDEGELALVNGKHLAFCRAEQKPLWLHLTTYEPLSVGERMIEKQSSRGRYRQMIFGRLRIWIAVFQREELLRVHRRPPVLFRRANELIRRTMRLCRRQWETWSRGIDLPSNQMA